MFCVWEDTKSEEESYATKIFVDIFLLLLLSVRYVSHLFLSLSLKLLPSSLFLSIYSAMKCMAGKSMHGKCSQGIRNILLESTNGSSFGQPGL